MHATSRCVHMYSSSTFGMRWTRGRKHQEAFKVAEGSGEAKEIQFPAPQGAACPLVPFSGLQLGPSGGCWGLCSWEAAGPLCQRGKLARLSQPLLCLGHLSHCRIICIWPGLCSSCAQFVPLSGCACLVSPASSCGGEETSKATGTGQLISKKLRGKKRFPPLPGLLPKPSEA